MLFELIKVILSIAKNLQNFIDAGKSMWRSFV